MMTIGTLLLLAVQEPEYAAAMKKVAARFGGKEGVVLHIGDSITYANPYSAWARHGKGKSPREQDVLKWMHAGKQDETDGWWLCSVDRPGGRSETAVGGIRSEEWLKGGKAGIAPLAEVVRRYNPRMAVILLGTNDVTARRPVADYKADMLKVVDTVLANGTIPILTTLPPYQGRDAIVKSFNDALWEVAKARSLPVIDYGGEILKRRPADWLGTLVSGDGVHPTASTGGTSPADEPTEENLRNSGYLLRSVLTVRKILEVRDKVLSN